MSKRAALTMFAIAAALVAGEVGIIYGIQFDHLDFHNPIWRYAPPLMTGAALGLSSIPAMLV